MNTPALSLPFTPDSQTACLPVGLSTDVETSRRKFLVAQTRRLVEQAQQRRQVDRNTPVVLPSPKPFDAPGGVVPPRRDRPGDGLDNEQPRTAGRCLEQLHLDGAAVSVAQLVEGIGRDGRAGRSERGKPLQIADPGVPVQVQIAVGAPAFVHRPGMTIDSENRRSLVRAQRPCGSGDPGAAPKVDDVGRGGAAASHGAHDMGDGQQVKRAVKQRECRALAGGGEGGAGGKFLAALNICGRQCPERACDFGNAEIGEMTRFKLRQPAGEAFVLR